MRRRDLFREAGRTGLALGLAAAGRPLIAMPSSGPQASGAPSAADDLVLMNTALALEHEAIWAYGLAGNSGLLSAKAKEVGALAADFNALSGTYGYVRGKAKAMVTAPKKN